jgi:hypothetical protein
MEKTALLENLAAVQGLASQSKAHVEAQKAIIEALIAMGKDPAAAERILNKLETVQTDNLSDMESILNALDGEPP